MNDQQHDDMLLLRQLLEDPAADPVDLTECYVRVLSDQLLVLAAQGHKQSGRGLIEIDLRGIDLRNARGGIPIHFFPRADYGDDWPREAFEMMDSYDPNRELIALVFHDTGPMIFVLEFRT
jgi:hypothetical protein